ncbi:MAG: hypothetical protein KDC34_12800 [Saprospiraceae bacterium]|nr:hypothetical protein [Saprospiraceae bacterium]
MRLIINLVLLALVAVLIWVLIGTIREPIAFKAEKERREDAVKAKLMLVRQTQELFRGVTGAFAPTFDSLTYVLRNDSFQIIQVFGDPDDPNNQEAIRYDTLYRSAYDSIQALGINLDSLHYVPYGGGASFHIAADTMTYQKTLVNVVEVGVPYSIFMGKFGDARFAKYDNSYDPKRVMKFGDMNAPNLSGNWE